tara:strand:+ start:124 stop:2172 length:2049 start_codon:yes stop_codon:yes gene_type:complete
MSKSRDIADSAATINFIDTVTSNVQNQIDNLDPLPSQTGNAGKFLTTDGTNDSWDVLTPATLTTKGVVEQSTSAENVAGTDDTVFPSVAGTKQMIGTHTTPSGAKDFTSNGAIPTGSAVVLRSDGDVEVVTAVYNSTVTAGSAVQFDSNGNGDTYNKIASQTTSNKVVASFADASQGLYASAIVGTVNPATNLTTWGTKVLIETNGASTWNSICYDENADKFVVCYIRSGDVYAAIGTISGTSISFGTPVAVATTGSYDGTSCVYESSTNKVVIAYGGDNLLARVGTISGTSISFGTESTVVSGFSYNPAITYDITNNKIVLAWNGNEGPGKAIVGTISGTTISWGTAAQFQGGATKRVTITYDSDTSQVLIAWVGLVASAGFVCTGAVSGTSISFGTSVIFDDDGLVGNRNGISYGSGSKVFCIIYSNQGGSGATDTRLGTVSGTSITLGANIRLETSTSGNFQSVGYNPVANKFVGIYNLSGTGRRARVISASLASTNANEVFGVATTGVSTGATVTITILGGTNANQSGMTAGDLQYINADGGISSTPSAYTKIGTALSATALLVSPEVPSVPTGAAKAYLSTIGSGTPAIEGSFNITSITDEATGRISVTLDTDFANVTYTILVSSYGNSPTTQGVNSSIDRNNYDKTAGSFNIWTFNSSGSIADPTTGINVACFGDQ